MFFSPATRLLWNAGALIRSQLLLYYNQICKVVDFSVLTGTTDVMIVITSVCQKKRGGKKKSTHGSNIWDSSNWNKLRTLAEFIILNNVLLATHKHIVFT